MLPNGLGSLRRVLYRRVSPQNCGLAVSSTLQTEMLPLQVLNMAARNVGDDLTALVRHSDRGSSDVSLTRTNRSLEFGGTPSIQSNGASYGCQSVSAWFRKNRVVLAGTV